MHLGAGVARQPFRLQGAAFVALPEFSRLSQRLGVSRERSRQG